MMPAVFCGGDADGVLERSYEMRVVKESDVLGYVAYAAVGRAEECLRGVDADVRNVVRRRHLRQRMEKPPELRRRVVGDCCKRVNGDVFSVVLVQVHDGLANRVVPVGRAHLLLRTPVHGRRADSLSVD